MPGGGVRSALVLSGSEGVDHGASHVKPPTPALLELARLLGDRAVGGFEVSMMTSAEAPALRLELIRFLADRVPEDTVVVHVAADLVLDQTADAQTADAHPTDAHPGGVRSGGAQRTNEALPLTFLQAELSRCRSERVVIILACPPDRTPDPSNPPPRWHDLALQERLGGPGRSVLVASTATVIDALQGRSAPGRLAAAEALREALLAPHPEPERHSTQALSLPLLGALGALAAVVVLTSALVIDALGAAGVALSAIPLVGVAWPLAGLGMQLWRQLPQEVALGEGVPFHELYMLRRSKKSKDHFRHHGPR